MYKLCEFYVLQSGSTITIIVNVTLGFLLTKRVYLLFILLGLSMIFVDLIFFVIRELSTITQIFSIAL